MSMLMSIPLAVRCITYFGAIPAAVCVTAIAATAAPKAYVCVSTCGVAAAAEKESKWLAGSV